jgi:hypothetical protein
MTHGGPQWWLANIIWAVLFESPSHKHMHRNAASIRRVTMGGCRRMTHGGAQWWWPAKTVRVDLMDFCYERQSEWYTHEHKHPKFCFWE